MMLDITGLSKRFGALKVTDGVCLTVAERELHAVIGPNGAGKTTLISLISGELRPDGGAIRLAGQDVTARPAPARARAGLGRSFQITQLFADYTAEQNICLALLAARGHAFHFWRPALHDPALRHRAAELLHHAGLETRAGTAVANLSHGERRQLELAMVMARSARVLLLDEPMAGLGPEESVRMTATIAALKHSVAILLVEHDMDAVFALADRISVLVRGQIVSTGPPAAIRADPAVQAAYLGDHA